VKSIVVKVIETATYVSQSEPLCSEVELEAIRFILARKPLRGSEWEEDPSLLVLKWGKKNPIHVVYIVSTDLKRIILLAAWAVPPPKFAKNDKELVSTIIDKLKSLGAAYALKELLKRIWDALKEMDDWFK